MDTFEGTFTQAPLTASQDIEEEGFKEKTLALPGAQPVDTMETVARLLVKERPSNFEDCVAWARLLWQELFHNQIAQLLHNFPPDQVTSTGSPFWSGPKKCPTALVWNFEEAAANLKAEIYGIEKNKDRSVIKAIIAKVNVPTFEPKSGIKIAVTDAEAQAQAQGGEMSDS